MCFVGRVLGIFRSLSRVAFTACTENARRIREDVVRLRAFAIGDRARSIDDKREREREREVVKSTDEKNALGREAGKLRCVCMCVALARYARAAHSCSLLSPRTPLMHRGPLFLGWSRVCAPRVSASGRVWNTRENERGEGRGTERVK